MAGFYLHQSNISLSHMQKVPVRKEVQVPNILGYNTLKCDFHIHTIFSDAVVWPEYRVTEAWENGLDAIAITDHIEYQPSKKYVAGDHNSGYNVAFSKAIEKDILLIRGGEITRSMPPGHLNALFLNDVNPLDTPDVMDAILEAKKQGAFLVWNHPGGRDLESSNCVWLPMHQQLLEEGLLNGIEVFNKQEWYPTALKWAMDKKLSVFANSDTHDIIAHYYDVENNIRPMTLVFSRERTIEAIREALFENRTVAFFDGKLAGNERYLKEVFYQSVHFSKIGETSTILDNTSDIPYYIQIQNKGRQLFIPEKRKMTVNYSFDTGDVLVIKNLYVSGEESLELKIQ